MYMSCRRSFFRFLPPTALLKRPLKRNFEDETHPVQEKRIHQANISASFEERTCTSRYVVNGINYLGNLVIRTLPLQIILFEF